MGCISPLFLPRFERLSPTRVAVGPPPRSRLLFLRTSSGCSCISSRRRPTDRRTDAFSSDRPPLAVAAASESATPGKGWLRKKERKKERKKSRAKIRHGGTSDQSEAAFTRPQLPQQPASQPATMTTMTTTLEGNFITCSPGIMLWRGWWMASIHWTDISFLSSCSFLVSPRGILSGGKVDQ